MTKLKKYNTIDDWNNATGLKYPSVGKLSDGTVLFKEPEIKAGDVAYWDGEKVKCAPLRLYSESYGPAIGVVVIPKNFTCDGKIRIMSLAWAGYDNGPSSSYNSKPYGPQEDSSLTNFSFQGQFGISIYFPVEGGANKSSMSSDEKCGYTSTGSYWYGPYSSNDTRNSGFFSCSPSEYRASDDTSGLNNTEVLYNYASGSAAGYCWRFKDGYSNLQWYLPALGEFAFLVSRVRTISATCKHFGFDGMDYDHNYWTSTEATQNGAYTVNPTTGECYMYRKNEYRVYRPFAIID